MAADGCRSRARRGVMTDPGGVADAVARYTRRYQEPRVNPGRVAIEIAVERILGRA